MSDYTRGKIAVGLAVGGIVFLVGIPFILAEIALFIDEKLDLPSLTESNFISIPLIVLGLLLVAWAAFAQIKTGRGTPVPAIPTQKLVVTGPYKLCRNPMLLGTVIYYLGVSFWINSLSSIALTALFLVCSIAYIKIVEEKELEARFGEEYREYKRKTPFLIPRFKKRKKR